MGLLDSYRKQQEEQKKNNPERLPTQGQLALRVLVGGYLYYLVYQLYTGGALKETGGKLAVMIGGMILFVVFGTYFLINAVRAMVKHEYYDMHAAPSASEEDGGEKKDGADAAEEQETEN